MINPLDKPSTSLRWPAEWEANECIWMTWPQNEDTWGAVRGKVEAAYERVISAIAPFQEVRLLAHLPEARRDAERRLAEVRERFPGRVEILPCPSNDSWIRDYGALTVTVAPAAPVALEQFDASAKRPLLGFGDGWHEQEFNPRTGARWRWLSERGELRVQRPPLPDDRQPMPALVLHVEGESPRTYFPRASGLVVRSTEGVLFKGPLASDFSMDIPIPNAAASIVLETDQTYVPSERSSRTADRRHLGLRIFKVEVRTREP